MLLISCSIFSTTCVWCWQALEQRLPETIRVCLDGEREWVEIPVSWFCVTEDYPESDSYYYQFSPRWDEKLYELEEGLDPLADVPYVGLFLTEEEEITLESVTGNTNEILIYRYLKDTLGFNTAAACGIMVNIYSESSYKPTNLQNTYEKPLGHTDESYTRAVDNGTYTNFVRDTAGYGLCQWTFWSRKQGLLDRARTRGVSIGNLEMQLEYMYSEMSSAVKRYLKNVPNTEQGAYDAAHYFCTYYEKPANTEKAAVIRGNLAQNTYWPEYSTRVQVTFDAGQGTVSPAEKTGVCGEAYGELPVAVREGYTFLGWSVSADAVRFCTAETVLGISEDHTLYAIWQRGITVSFDPCGGSVEPGKKRVYTGEPYGELPTPVWEGKVFLGWSPEPDSTGFCTAETVVDCGAAHTLYAIWHHHDLTHHAADAPSCTEPGRREYWYCGSCGGYFADAEGREALGEAVWFLPALGHTFENGSCGRCGTQAEVTLHCGGFHAGAQGIAVTVCVENPVPEAAYGSLYAAVYENGRMTAIVRKGGISAESGVVAETLILPVEFDWETPPVVKLFFLTEDSWPLAAAAAALPES